LGDNETYDARVQAVLDQYWPGTTDMQNIKRNGNNDRDIYQAYYQDSKVIFKSTWYSDEGYASTEQYKTFLNFMNEEVPVAAYIAPSIATSDDGDERKLMVTMSIYAEGYKAQDLPPDAPWTWIYDEAAVKTMGAWCGAYRHQAIAFKSAHPDTYASFRKWDEGPNSWQKNFTTPNIPVDTETFGVIHGDFHTGNFKINYLGDNNFTMMGIDFDDAQRSWYIIDPGTITWAANMSMLVKGVSHEDRLAHLEQFKVWLLEAYGWPTTMEELQEGCEWRRQFMEAISVMSLAGVPPTDPGFWGLLLYIGLNEAGLIPSC